MREFNWMYISCADEYALFTGISFHCGVWIRRRMGAWFIMASFIDEAWEPMHGVTTEAEAKAVAITRYRMQI
jgi:hypothetical protein